jgi:DNA-binding NtrC family response regulator
MKSEPWALKGPTHAYGSPSVARESATREERGSAESIPPPSIIGSSPAMIALLRQLERVADSSRPVLLVGPTGAGKDLAAWTIHRWSARCREPLVDVNCGAIPDHLAERELFGHERGAFTGADRRCDGAFARARGGTLFFDEVAALSMSVQARLLRPLETGRFRPIGGVEQVFLGRVIAATNVDLAQAVRRGTFREDLYYRLRVLPVEIPALVHRPGDVPLLVERFMGQQESPCRLTDGALDALATYEWPGNVRQLRNLIDRLALLADHGVIDEGAVRRELALETAGAPAPCELRALAR